MKIAAAFTLLLFLSCSQTGDTGKAVPGDTDYVPPGWTAPELAYPIEAYTPSAVHSFSQGPGQFAADSDFSIADNTGKLLGFPRGGGTLQGSTESTVSLGMAGGYVCLEFDPPIEDHPDNIGGYDFIVFGNAYWTGTADSGTWKEPGVITVMKDENGDGILNDTWYLIPGSYLDQSALPENISYTQGDFSESWWPSSAGSISYNAVYILPDSAFDVYGAPGWGFADITPVLRLGDLSGALRGYENNGIAEIEDYPGIDPVYFYTVPDDHTSEGIDAGSGGGDALDIAWAVDPVTFESAGLDEISWIKITSSSSQKDALLGDQSTEIDAVTRVRRQ